MTTSEIRTSAIENSFAEIGLNVEVDKKVYMTKRRGMYHNSKVETSLKETPTA